mmetsp:Transcript_9705/g.23893  ORF Transcript_9705/g.23893 Transcript_9705/m.23893 type:complete len:249 (-) Transcript_9705:293-1039(-)|eukprot:g15674.t1
MFGTTRRPADEGRPPPGADMGLPREVLRGVVVPPIIPLPLSPAPPPFRGEVVLAEAFDNEATEGDRGGGPLYIVPLFVGEFPEVRGDAVGNQVVVPGAAATPCARPGVLVFRGDSKAASELARLNDAALEVEKSALCFRGEFEIEFASLPLVFRAWESSGRRAISLCMSIFSAAAARSHGVALDAEERLSVPLGKTEFGSPIAPPRPAGLCSPECALCGRGRSRELAREFCGVVLADVCVLASPPPNN